MKNYRQYPSLDLSLGLREYLMKLPSLRISLPFIFLCWCLAGVQAHGLVILAYPAMWAVIGLGFLGLHLMTRAPAGSQLAAGGTSAGSISTGSNPVTAAAESSRLNPVHDTAPSDPSKSTPV